MAGSWKRWQGVVRRTGETFMRWFWRLGVPVGALGVLVFTGPELVPAWEAHLGAGKPGTFTATQESCAKSCVWYGSFVSSDGAVTRYDVRLAGGHIAGVGDRTRALDTASPSSVYPADGGSEWLFVTVASLIGAVVLWVWVDRVPLEYFRRRRPAPRVRSIPSGKPDL
jgi:hypothetical protein